MPGQHGDTAVERNWFVPPALWQPAKLRYHRQGYWSNHMFTNMSSKLYFYHTNKLANIAYTWVYSTCTSNMNHDKSISSIFAHLPPLRSTERNREEYKETVLKTESKDENQKQRQKKRNIPSYLVPQTQFRSSPSQDEPFLPRVALERTGASPDLVWKLYWCPTFDAQVLPFKLSPCAPCYQPLSPISPAWLWLWLRKTERTTSTMH